MAKVDLHVHSKFSNHPTEWFLKRLGANECYTEPDFIYQTARANGMDFVTITDHNKIEGALRLKAKHADSVITGVEFTAYFPEDQCKIHVLVYGLDEQQYQDIQRIRTDIYQLRDYLKDQDLAHAVAHATYPVNGKLKLAHLEKLILLFDHFEAINGGRNRINNETWMNILSQLTPNHISDLYNKHRIDPISDHPWEKGFTAGSDDHAGLFIGQTYAVVEAQTAEEVIARIKAKQAYASGRHNDYKALAFTVYKVAYDFSKHKKGMLLNSFIKSISEYAFEKRELGMADRLKLKKMKHADKKNGNRIYRLLYDLVENLKNSRTRPMDDKISVIFNKITDISDEFMWILFRSLEKDLEKVNLFTIFRNLSASLPGIFLSIPFFTTLKHMYRSRNILARLNARFPVRDLKESKRILWFTDTLNDLNGVSVSLKTIGWLAYKKNVNLRMVTSLMVDELDNKLPPDVMKLPHIFSFHLPGYEKYVLKIPSILKSLEIIYRYNPDVIYISTPGPIGLVGLLAANLLSIPAIGFYHTDFALQTAKIIEDESISTMMGSYVKWFYNQMDGIRVPSQEYVSILADRGYNTNDLRMFRRGLDTSLFYPRLHGKQVLQSRFNVAPGINLLYAGRISKDKGLDFLLDIFLALRTQHDTVNLLFAGDGPYLPELKEKHADTPGVFWLGRVEQQLLPDVYSGCDAFLFPSVTDTFGMVVLEALACGLPAIVSDMGGPREIVVHGKTGYVLPADDVKAWQKAIADLIHMIHNDPPQYNKLKKQARKHVEKYYDWENIFKSLLENGGNAKGSHGKNQLVAAKAG